jgi:hypothetical protein
MLRRSKTKEKADEIAEQVKADIWKEIFKFTRSLEFQNATFTGELQKTGRAVLDIRGKATTATNSAVGSS